MLMPPTLPMAMATPMPLLFPLAPALVLTQSPRELFFLMLDMLDTTVTTLARGLLMPMPTMQLTPMPMDMLMLSPRELPFPMLDMLDTTVTTLARGLLMPMPT